MMTTIPTTNLDSLGEFGMDAQDCKALAIKFMWKAPWLMVRITQGDSTKERDIRAECPSTKGNDVG